MEQINENLAHLIGKKASLKISRFTKFGAFLSVDSENLQAQNLQTQKAQKQGQGEILLPNVFVPKGAQVGQCVQTFITLDSENRIVATTQMPKLFVGDIGALQVVQVVENGYFLDNGLEKHLFAPSKMPNANAQKIVVFVTKDKQNRLIGRLGVQERLKKCAQNLRGLEFDALIFKISDLGYCCAVNGHFGLLYKNEVFENLKVGDVVRVSVKKTRDDGKLDLKLLAQNPQDKILSILKNAQLNLDFKSEPTEIENILNMSKKTFKTAANALVRQNLAIFEDDYKNAGRKILRLV